MTYSGFWRRFAAAIIDGVILIIPSAVIGGSSGDWGFTAGAGSLLIGLLYYPVFESSALCGTPGKDIMGMVVLSEAGERITFKTAVIRFLLSYVSALICGIGYIMQLFTSKRQTLHDMISETVVIDRESPDTNYFSAWKSQFKDIVNKL